jgi:peroxiredoxin (alkyl hydroperoxide reductase subunit C)
MFRQLFRHFPSLTIKTTTSPFRYLPHRTHHCNPFPAISKGAPEFKGQAVINGHFKDIQLSDYKGKYVVLFFYPLDFTFVCPTELVAFNEKLEEFRQLDTEIIGCSTDSVYSHLAWINTPRQQGGLGGLKYPLLSDFSKEISRRYGVLIDDNGGIALRGLFIIDREQNLRQITINDLPVGRSVDEILRLVRAFQFVEKHGEVCPANWNEKTNPNTIKPDPIKSKEYFQKQE